MFLVRVIVTAVSFLSQLYSDETFAYFKSNSFFIAL